MNEEERIVAEAYKNSDSLAHATGEVIEAINEETRAHAEMGSRGTLIVSYNHPEVIEGVNNALLQFGYTYTKPSAYDNTGQRAVRVEYQHEREVWG